MLTLIQCTQPGTVSHATVSSLSGGEAGNHFQDLTFGLRNTLAGTKVGSTRSACQDSVPHKMQWDYGRLLEETSISMPVTATMFHQQCCCTKRDLKRSFRMSPILPPAQSRPLVIPEEPFSVLILQICSGRDATASLGNLLHTSPAPGFS